MRPMSALTPFVAALALTASAVLVAFALPVPAHAVSIGGAEFVVGSGNVVDIRRQVPAFTKLRVDGSVDVVARPGAEPGVDVHADDNVVPLIETVVEGDTLVVRLRKGASFHSRHGTKVTVAFTSLSTTTQLGSGDLRLEGLSAPRLESSIAGAGDLTVVGVQLGSFSLRIAGSGDARLSGRADDAHYAIAGSGDISAADLAARHVEVRISGSGDASVNASDSVDARIAGSGDVHYRGHPHDVTRHVSGSGEVDAAD